MDMNRESTVYPLLLELVSIDSVSPSGEKENKIADFILERLSREDYFRKNPGDLLSLPCQNDPLGRRGIFAIVRSEHTTDRTVLLTGHMDVVDTEVYGSLREFAFLPEELTGKIGKTDLPRHVRDDLESGDWLFGRGVSDMKCGIAVELSYLIEMSKKRDSLSMNIALLIVPDEENNSRGMLDAVPYLRKMQDEEGLKFLACVNSEPTVGSAENPGPTIYMGSIGKINSFFYCLGRESHVGEYYQGISAAPIVSNINLELDGNTAYSDSFNDISYPPYGCMRQHDLREEYSASIMAKGLAFYSYLTVSKLPGDVLSEMREVAWRALVDALDRHRKFSERFSKDRGLENRLPQWEPKVYSFGELLKKAEEGNGISAAEFAERITRECPAHFDERDKAIRLVERLIVECGIRGPLVVIGFLPPFYPHRATDGKTALERQLREAVRSAASGIEEKYAVSIEMKDFFEGVSDLSYCGFREGSGALKPLSDNTPGWGCCYPFPSEDISSMDIPVVNIGPIGKDAHKASERVFLPYAMRILPELIDGVIRRLGEGTDQDA